jgi:ABC-2 type transport system permease protein
MNWLTAKRRKYGSSAEVAIRNRWAYPGDFLGLVITYGLFVFVFSRIWIAAYSGRAEIVGYDRSMATWYFIVAELVVFSSGNHFWSFAREIRDGQVAYSLGRPYGFLAYQYAQKMGLALTQWVPFAAIGGLIGTAMAGPLRFSAAQLPVFVLSFLLAASLQYLIQACLAMTAFWLEENSAFYWIYSKISLVLGTLMPLEFLPLPLMRATLFTPFPYVTYVPARIAVAWEPGRAWALVGGQVAWTVAVGLLAAAIFSRGVRKTTIHGG